MCAGCNIYVNPYRELMEEEEKRNVAKQEKEDMDRKGIIPDSERTGTWFSNPKAAAQLPSAAAAVPRAEAGAGKQASSKVGLYITAQSASTSAKKAKMSDFDAW
jgi:hypothetical protein